jgi:hypothetical protein
MDDLYRHAVVLNGQKNPKIGSFLETELSKLDQSLLFSTQNPKEIQHIIRIGLKRHLEENENLTSAEKQRIITEELQKIQLTATNVKELGIDENKITGSVFKKPALVVLQQLGLIESSFALHIYKEQKEIEKRIWSSVYQLPVEEIKNVRQCTLRLLF